MMFRDWKEIVESLLDGDLKFVSIGELLKLFEQGLSPLRAAQTIIMKTK